MRRVFLLSVIMGLLSISSYAQKISVSTNIIDYLALGTMNADVSYAFSQHWSMTAGVRYNPFTFRKGEPRRQFQCRQQSYSLGVRMWLWHTWSGWWFAAKLRYQEYNAGGIFSQETQEGDRIGAGLYSGYTYMISNHFNVEFGIGLWGGSDIYSRYDCPVCGVCTSSGRKGFLLPDDLMIALVYVF